MQLNLFNADLRAKPFLKWLGGKRRLIKHIAREWPASVNTYHERFVGGGAVFFYLAPFIKQAVLSDKNSELITTYEVVKTQPQKLISALQVLAEHYKDDNDFFFVMRDKHHLTDPLEIAARMIFLNKTCYNGIYKVNANGNFAGGKGEEPRTKDGYYRKICIPSDIMNASKALQKATIVNGEFDEVIAPEKDDLVYCDPPYDGTDIKYQTGGFNQDDQIRLRDAADHWREAGANVILSNSKTDNVLSWYKSYRINTLKIQYKFNPLTQNARGKADEVLIMSYGKGE